MREILVIAGASAVGKTTVVKELVSLFDRFYLIRSATTRAPRGDGHDGEYLYYTREDFLLAKNSGEMLESMEYQGELYGTPRSELENCFEKGKTPVLILDLQGVASLSSVTDLNCCAVYLYDDIATIEDRLVQRYMNTEGGYEKILGRKNQNLNDYAKMLDYEPYFYAFIKNSGTVKECLEKILQVYNQEV